MPVAWRSPGAGAAPHLARAGVSARAGQGLGAVGGGPGCWLISAGPGSQAGRSLKDSSHFLGGSGNTLGAPVCFPFTPREQGLRPGILAEVWVFGSQLLPYHVAHQGACGVWGGGGASGCTAAPGGGSQLYLLATWEQEDHSPGRPLLQTRAGRGSCRSGLG